MQSQTSKNISNGKKRFLSGCFILLGISMGPFFTKVAVANKVEAKENNGFEAFSPSQTKINVTANVDYYLAVYKKNNGEIRVETNGTNKFFADRSVCVINY